MNCIIKSLILCLCLLELGTVGGSVKALAQSVLLQQNLILKILGYQSTYIIKNLGYQGSQSSKAGSFSNLLAKRFVSWHFPPKFGEHIIIELESEDSRWTFCSHPP